MLSAAACPPLPSSSTCETMLGGTLKMRVVLPTLCPQAHPASQTILARPEHPSPATSTLKQSPARRQQEETNAQPRIRVWGIPHSSTLCLWGMPYFPIKYLWHMSPFPLVYLNGTASHLFQGALHWMGNYMFYHLSITGCQVAVLLLATGKERSKLFLKYVMSTWVSFK